MKEIRQQGYEVILPLPLETPKVCLEQGEKNTDVGAKNEIHVQF
jgi:hypothetical protein